jgi:hypothetical protein
MPFWHGVVECSLCNDRHTAVIKLEADQKEPVMGLECPACEHSSCYPVNGDSEKESEE